MEKSQRSSQNYESTEQKTVQIETGSSKMDGDLGDKIRPASVHRSSSMKTQL